MRSRLNPAQILDPPQASPRSSSRSARHLPSRLAPPRPRHSLPTLRRGRRRASRQVRPGLHAPTTTERRRRPSPRVPARPGRVPRASRGGRRAGARGVRPRRRVAAGGQLGHVPHLGRPRVLARELGRPHRTQGRPVGPGCPRRDGSPPAWTALSCRTTVCPNPVPTALGLYG